MRGGGLNEGAEAVTMRLGRIAALLCAVSLAGAAGWLVYTGQDAALLQRAKSVAGVPGIKQDAEKGPRRGGSGQRAVTVEVSAARVGKVSSDIRAVGSLQSDESVVVAAEVAGRIAEITFAEGKPVKKDDVVVKLDAALANAEVADAKARLTLADANNDRAQALSKTGAVTGKSRDEAVANYETAQAALALAETRLSKMELRAPFDGVAGLRGVSVGAFVNVGTPIANLEKIDVLKVDFKIPEIHLGTVKAGQKVEITVDAYPDRTFEGEIYAINPLVDVNGRALQLRARLNNADQVLRPGLFARVLVKGTTEREAVFVPEAAVLPRGEDTFVYVVDGKQAVERRVKLGQRGNAEVEVLEGLTPNATIVTAGQHKLRDGVTVDIAPSDNRTGLEPAQSRNAATTNGRSG